MDWDPLLYDNSHSFVAEYGRRLLDFIPHNPSQTILDLGCGTGALTEQLLSFATKVMGVDQSEAMINKARMQYPQIDFQICDALALPFEKEWDVVFSNAVFHWISDHDTLLQNISAALKPNGVLICEFGAAGNISIIECAFMQACRNFRHEYHPQFNFPSTEAFSALLQKHGFIIDQIYDYPRPTVLQNGKYGLSKWLQQFFAPTLSLMTESAQVRLIKEVENTTKPFLWNGHAWVADYKRLRVIAHI